ncbi:MAG: glycosyltransferase family 1 protein [Candidatus Moranbacteria bacterium]|nr:glycosyltransferase family 1 protein [Candidatus Moranbacteria bacterium]
MLGRKRTGDESVFFNIVKNLALVDEVNEYSLFIDKRSSEEITAIVQSLGIEGKNNFRLVMLPAKNKFTWNFWMLPRYLRRYPVDVYHTQYIVPFFVPRDIKIVTHIHDVSFHAYPQYISWKDRFFLDALIPRSLKRADKIIAVSEFTKREIMERYAIGEGKISVVLNALSDDFLRYEPCDPERSARVRSKYALPERYILYVGTLQPRKNIPALIGAFARICEKLPDMQLVIVGNRKGHHYDTGIDAAIRENNLSDRIVFPGYVDQEDVFAVMQGALAFVFPSLYEGFGLPVLEAMSQRVPVVASDIPPLREVAVDAALFADTRDLAEFSEILYTISTVAKVREELITSGIKQMQRFSWRASAKRLRDVYVSLI